MAGTVSVICAIVKNEQRFIREWVEYYLNIGFDKLYIFEDFGSDSHYNEIHDYISENKVELIQLETANFVPHYNKGTKVQGDLYSRFLLKCQKENLADWVGFFDVDEFIMFEDGWNLEKLEEEFKDTGGVLLSWKLYGANGHMKRPEGKVVDNYTQHLPEGTRLDNCSKQWNVKSLVNVHNCHGKKSIHVFDDCVFTDGLPYEEGDMVYEKAWLNHYYTKSWEDYLDRIFKRGNMQNNFRCLDKFFKCNPELLSQKEKMVMAQRYRHTACTMWISRDLKVMSGGNLITIKELEKKYLKH